MSRDIRSFFTVFSKKSGSESSKNAPVPSKKKSKRLLDSDDEDVILVTPDKTDKKPEKKQKIILSSDSEDETPKKKKTILKSNSGSKLKPVNVLDVFTKTPIKQSKVEVITPPKVKPKIEKGTNKAKSRKKKDKEKKVHNDATFEQTLDDLDDDIFEKTIVEHFSELEETEASLQNEEEKSTQTEDSKNVNTKITESSDKKSEEKNKATPSKFTMKRSRTDSSDGSTPKKKKPMEHSDSGIDPGQEAHEKKRFSAILYQKYLNRGGPKNHGMKEIPKGKPDCLKGLCFLRTGVLDSLESEEFNNLIKEHGGRVVQAVSGKVSYVVVGEEPGPAKLAKAESLNIPTINEDELLDLVLTKSGMKPKYCKKNTSGESEDLGIEADTEVTIIEKKETKTEEDSVKKKEDLSKKKNHSKTEKSLSEKIEHSSKKEVVKIFEELPESSTASHFFNNVDTSQGHCSSTPSQKQNDDKSLPLTEKYKPQTLKAVIGQQGESSNLYKLKNWLENWHRNQDPKVKKSLIRPSPWAKNDTGAYYKCALLSGPPGVGKTTTATLVSKELGLDIVEFNASDTRSKRSLREEVSQLLGSKTIAGFATGASNLSSKRVLLMDEVDGMAGNEDRGGMQELIQLIKNTSVPIICMCNDRNHQKIRSLVNYCFDLRFVKPKLEQIKGAMMSICFKEKIDISPQALTEIISGTGCDVRQTLNHLALLSSDDQKITTEMAEKEAKCSKKDSVMGPWEVCRAVFTKSEQKNMSVIDKARLFFYDYSLGPLFVQENYLKVQPDGASKKETLLKAALSADSLSMGDIVDSKIRRNNNWALLDSQAFFFSVLPGHYMSGSFTGQINFPSWLGKNSKKNKFSRLISEIQTHTRTSASASKLGVMLDYLVALRNAIMNPLKTKGLEGVETAVEVMKTYNLLREDVDSLLELCQWTNGENPMNSIESKVKSAFTRAYNKQVSLLPFAPTSSMSKKRAAAAVENDLLDEEEENVSDNEEDDISKNSMIKVKKPSSKGKKGGEVSTSNKKENKKGKGKKAK